MTLNTTVLCVEGNTPTFIILRVNSQWKFDLRHAVLCNKTFMMMEDNLVHVYRHTSNTKVCLGNNQRVTLTITVIVDYFLNKNELFGLI